MPQTSPNPLKNRSTRSMRVGLIALVAAMALLVWVVAASGFWFWESKSGAKNESLGLVRVEGMILDATKVNEWIAELRDDPKILGVVVRVDSPGGVVGPSQEIHRAVKRLGQRKPVVVSMGAVAASGGYYVACPARWIVANPGTLTGSIGVKMELTNLMGIMDKIGVGRQALTSGKFKDTPSSFKELSPEEKQYLQTLIQDLYSQFTTDVAEGRKLDPAKVKGIADGRILTGKQAKEEGLVDELGGLEESFDKLKQLCGVTKKLPILKGPKEKTTFLKDLLASLSLAPGGEEVLGPRWQFLYK